MSGIWHSAWVSLGRKGLRSLLTVSSIAIGTAMVVLVLGVGQVGAQAVNTELEEMGVNGLSVSASDGLTMPCLKAIRGLSQVSQAMPLSLQFAAAQMAEETYTVVGCGIDAGADQVISLKLLHGRLLSPGDISGQTAVCVVDASLALEMCGRQNVVGERLTLLYDTGTVTLTVVGVTATGSSLLQNVTSLIPYMVYVPYTTQQTVTGVQAFDQIAVRLAEDALSVDTAAAIRRTVLRTGEPVGTLTTEDLASQRERLDKLVDIISLVLAAVSGVSLLVSGFGILTVMLSSVNERTREIGIKKAIGATRRRIWLEFLAGALFLSLFGALAGTALGTSGVLVGCGLLGISPTLPWGRLAAVFGLTLVLGMAFGAYPAYRAAGLRPVEALRYEG